MLKNFVNDTLSNTKTKTGMLFMYSSAISNTKHHGKTFLYMRENKKRKKSTEI